MASSLNLLGIDDEHGISMDTEYVVHTVKCFLCDHDFVEGEEPWLMFEKRFGNGGEVENPLSVILSSALGCDLEEFTAHSTLLCEKCKHVVLEFESLEQRFCEVRYRILRAYNRTAKNNDLPSIAIEINGVLEDVNLCDLKEGDDPAGDDGAGDDGAADDAAGDDAGGDDAAGDDGAGDDGAGDDGAGDEKGELLVVKQEQLTDLSDSLEFTSIGDTRNAFSMYDLVDVVQDGAIVEIADNLPYATMSGESDLQLAGLGVDGETDMIVFDEIIEQSSQSGDENGNENPDVATDGDSSQSGQFDDNGVDPTAEILFNLESDVTATSYAEDESATVHVGQDQSSGESQLGFYVRREGKFHCQMCRACEPLDAKAFTEHLRTQHSLAFYPCELCGNGYMRRKELSAHIEEQHADNALFECKSCSRNFTDYRMFRIHRRMHYASARQHECSVCSKKYSSKNLLEEHMNMHTGQRPFKCSKCTKDFASKYSLQAHMKIHTERQRAYQCDQCDKAFLKQQNLTQHKQLHMGIKSFVCDVCSKAFSTQHNLDVHKIVHSGQRPFDCRICGKTFARRAEIRDHERIHTGERPFKCEQCPAAFAQRSNLMSHKKTTHLNEKLHSCTQCDRSFKRRRLLDYHIKSIHTGERPHKCEICGAAFVYPEHYKKHMIIHSATKPFACEVCGKEFNSRDNRNAHRFVHSTKKPYECMECGAGFMRKPLLLAHMRQTLHVNDTIIVNQPLINGVSTSDKNELQYVHVDANDEGDADADADADGGPDGDADADGDGEELLGNGDMSNDSMNRVLIKDEMDDVKYLQFEEFDGDGQETLTWVDIGNDKD